MRTDENDRMWTDADEDRIRRALELIGGAAAGAQPGQRAAEPPGEPGLLSLLREPAPGIRPAPRRRPARRGRWPAVAAAAAVVAAVVSLGLWWQPSVGSQDSGSSASSAQDSEAGQGSGAWAKASWAAVIPCSRVIAEGNVVSVSEAAGGRAVLTFDVTDWLWPKGGRGQGGNRLALDIPDPAPDGATDPWQPDEHLLIVVPNAHDQPVDDFTGADIAAVRARIEPELARAEHNECTLDAS
ncbi:hypothetical protein OK074_1698 [Actinobacteria bacterium OK074]|nr:hypothetical protein OK074_1698 [Actinobacteria bacterium OK074]